VNVPLTVAAGGNAAIVEHQGDHVVLRSSVASPPGSTLNLQHGEIPVHVKVRGCKRLDESELPFRIEGRLLSFTRAARDVVFGHE
jgi:hypothetical protein